MRDFSRAYRNETSPSSMQLKMLTLVCLLSVSLAFPGTNSSFSTSSSSHEPVSSRLCWREGESHIRFCSVLHQEFTLLKITLLFHSFYYNLLLVWLELSHAPAYGYVERSENACGDDVQNVLHQRVHQILSLLKKWVHLFIERLERTEFTLIKRSLSMKIQPCRTLSSKASRWINILIAARLESSEGGSWNCVASRNGNLHFATSSRKKYFIHFVQGNLEILLFRSDKGLFWMGWSRMYPKVSRIRSPFCTE